jgi:hypothetical protein
MRAAPTRILLVFVCLVFGLGLLVTSSPAGAADKKKAWASKKHKKAHHKASKPAAKAAGSTAGAAAAEEDDEDEGDEAPQGAAAKDDDAKPKPKPKAASNDKAASKDESSDEGEREASKEKGDDDDDDDGGGSTVVRRKAKRPVMEGGGAAPIALELEAGPRLVHRTFDFNDPLSNHVPTAAKPYAYKLGAAPAPFVDLGLYPAAFATRGIAASFGIVASYEKLVGTKTTDAMGASIDTLAQQFEVGLRGRLPLADHEVGVRATYGKQTFHVSQTDPGPGGGSVPNVDYTFAGFGADARLRFSPIEIGAHVGTRAVLDTGSLNKNWFSTVKTTTIGGGLSVAYRLTPMFDVVGGVDFMRYAFDFNPITMTTLVAGGAVDQYISGFLALRVSLSGG